MNLEQQLTDAIGAQNALTQVVANKMGSLDARIDGFIAAQNGLVQGLNNKMSTLDSRINSLVERWDMSGSTALTTSGSAPAFTVTVASTIAAYTTRQRLRVKFNAAGSGTDTLNINGLGAKSLKQYDATGNKLAAVITANQLADVEFDGTDFVLLDPLPAAKQGVLQVVQGGCLSSISSTSADYVDTGLSAAITPISTNSKILVLVDQSCKAYASDVTVLGLRILRNSTSIMTYPCVAGYNCNAAIDGYSMVGLQLLDSPVTLSTITYKTQFARTRQKDGPYGNYVAVQPEATSSRITLLEIAG